MKSEREINHSHDSRDVDNRQLDEQCAYLTDRVKVLSEERKALLERIAQLEQELQRISRE